MRLPLYTKKWENNQGLIGCSFFNLIFNPYSKTPRVLKNKSFSKWYPARLKEFHYTPSLNKNTSAFLLSDLKKEVWLEQSVFLKNDFQAYGIIYTYKPKFGFIAGVNGVPVLLHRNQLFLSYRQLQKSSNLFNFGQNFESRVFGKYILEKRINLIILKLLKRQ